MIVIEELYRSLLSDQYQVYENEYMFQWKEGLILCACYKKGAIIGEEAAKALISFRKKYFPGHHRVLIYTNDINCMDAAAKRILSSDEAMEDIIKGAIVVNSFAHKLLGNLYLGMVKSKVPTRLFTDKPAAMDWLKR